jgi:hypothetical protein
MPDQARWFDALGTCVCNKPAEGVVRGPGNESYGSYCRKCAEKRIKKAEKERADQEKENLRQ